jgi:hypothetical protein
MGTGDQMSSADVRIAVAGAHTEIEGECLKLAAEVQRLKGRLGETDSARLQGWHEVARLQAEVAKLVDVLRWARACVPFPSDCHTAIVNTLKEKN